MAFRPEIFISAGAELAGARKALKLALLEIGAQPVEQTDVTIPYGPLEGVLKQMIGRCDAVVHLVGPRYGVEPGERTLGAARRSFGQYEVDVAESLAKPVYYFVAENGYPAQGYAPEKEELRELQWKHRRAIELSGRVAGTFETADDLSRLIRGLRRKLVVRRRLAVLPRASLGSKFAGRRQMMASLAEELAPEKPIALHPMEGVAPAGGVGTTTLAIELAWHVFETRRYDFVFQIPTGVRADIEASLAALARSDALALVAKEVVSHRARVDAVFEWFGAEENAGRWLVIFDGVDNTVTWLTVRGMLAHFTKGAVLVTGQLDHWTGLRTQHVAPFSYDHAREYLLDGLGTFATALTTTERNATDQLGEILGRVPLALKIAARHLRGLKTTPSAFLPAWLPDPRHPTRPWRQLTLATLLEKSVAQLEAPARSLLQLLTCLAPEPAAIPLALFESRGDWEQLREALASLEQRALLTRDESGHCVYLHRGLREIIRDRLSPSELSTALGAARAAVDTALRRVESGASGTALREKLVPHCRALLGQLNGHPLEEHAGYIAQSLAHWLKDCGRPFEAEPLYRRALAIDEKHFKEGITNLAPRLRDLAAVLRNTGGKTEIETLYRRALHLSQEFHGADHPEVAADLMNLASCMRAGNRLEDAERLYRRALQIEEQNAGRSHPRTAIVLNRLAGVLELSGRLVEADAYYRRALKIDEETSDPGHPRIVVVLQNLAGVLLAMRRYADAASLYRQALAIDEAKFGKDQVELSPAMRGLAFALEDSGERAEAEDLYRRVLGIDEKEFGPMHPEVAVDLHNLAGCLWDAGKPDEAAELQRRAVEIFASRRIQLRGPNPHLKSAITNFTGILRAQGKSEEEAQECVDNVINIYSMQPRRTMLA